MTATTWQPGETVYPNRSNTDWIIAGANHHDALEEIHDHYDNVCDWCWSWGAGDWMQESQLGPHDDTEPPLPWLHGVAA